MSQEQDKNYLTPTRVAVLAGTGYIIKKLHDQVKKKKNEPGASSESVGRAKMKANDIALSLAAIAQGGVK